MSVGTEVHEQLVDGIDRLGGLGVRSVDLVDGHDHRQVPRHGLLEHVPRLGQRTLRRVDEQEDGVDHQQAALDLAAEVGMARGVDDVQPHVAVLDAGLLGQDGDALFAFEIARVHNSLGDDLVGAERARLAKHRVDERGLAVVDMGHDRHVADVVAHGGAGVCLGGRHQHLGGTLHGEFRLSHGVGFGALGRYDAVVTVAAVILYHDIEGALADAAGRQSVRRAVESAWAGGATPIVVVSFDREGQVAAALTGSPAVLAEPAPAEHGPVGQMVRGITVAQEQVTETEAAIVWPGRMAWVDAETVTSLIEAYGAQRGSVLRPVYQDEPGWPVLVPVEYVEALQALGPALMPDVLMNEFFAQAPQSATVDTGDPGTVHDISTHMDALPEFEGPPQPVAGLRTRVGRGRCRDARRLTPRGARAVRPTPKPPTRATNRRSAGAEVVQSLDVAAARRHVGDAVGSIGAPWCRLGFDVACQSGHCRDCIHRIAPTIGESP